jgi:hypothetical protein
MNPFGRDVAEDIHADPHHPTAAGSEGTDIAAV